MLTRPLVESRGLWTNPAPRIPPVHGMEKENKPYARHLCQANYISQVRADHTLTTPEILETYSLRTII